jgi:hypothetical protein
MPDQTFGLGAVRMGKQHRPGLRIQRLDLAHAVILLVRPGVFVLADAVAVVGGDRSDRHQPGLHVLAHRQPIGVIARTWESRHRTPAAIRRRKFSADLAYTSGA